MTTVFYTSDQHVGHVKVAVERFERFFGRRNPSVRVSPENREQYESRCVAWHDDALARQWDATVGKGDTVIVMGDISVGGTAAQRAALVWVSQRPGTKHLVTGNHDGPHAANRDADKWMREYHEVFASVLPYRRRKIAGQNVMLSHYPYQGDHTPHDRDTQYRLRDEGLPVLHGHTHSVSKGDAHQIHIGVDAWDLTPVSQEQVVERLTTRA